jgi:hypothetical protein
MVVFSLEVFQAYEKVRAHIYHRLVQHLSRTIGDNSTTKLRHENKMRRQVADDVTTASIAIGRL